MAADTAGEIRHADTSDASHADLARLIEDTARICAQATADRCCTCPADLLAACREKLDACGHRFRELLLRHVTEEQTLLAQLPCTEAAWKHRIRHRDHHQEFVSGYNRLVMDLGRGHPGKHLQGLEAMVASWARDHVLVFDKELATLLAGK